MRVRDRAVGHGFDRSARNHGRSACILRDLGGPCFPRLYVAASLKHLDQDVHAAPCPRRFSAALCRGLIEATCAGAPSISHQTCFPRLYVAASLKLAGQDGLGVPRADGFPRLYVAASLKPARQRQRRGRGARFSAALCRGLIEATACGRPSRSAGRRFPRLYVAASLKRLLGAGRVRGPAQFSAALCRGLIEATGAPCARPDRRAVFRGFMSRPH